MPLALADPSGRGLVLGTPGIFFNFTHICEKMTKIKGWCTPSLGLTPPPVWEILDPQLLFFNLLASDVTVNLLKRFPHKFGHSFFAGQAGHISFQIARLLHRLSVIFLDSFLYIVRCRVYVLVDYYEWI